jgi:hypothetical protein
MGKNASAEVPLTDEVIDHVVSLVASAEEYSLAMGFPSTSEGMRALLKAIQVMARVQQPAGAAMVASLATMAATKAD